jgi:hypothetical protein
LTTAATCWGEFTHLADNESLEQPSSHFLQRRHPAAVDLDQVVVGAEDRGNAALSFEGMFRNGRRPDSRRGSVPDLGTGGCCPDLLPGRSPVQRVINEAKLDRCATLGGDEAQALVVQARLPFGHERSASEQSFALRGHRDKQITGSENKPVGHRALVMLLIAPGFEPSRLVKISWREEMVRPLLAEKLA